MKTLQEIYDNHSRLSEAHFSDKGTVHSYLSVYEEILVPYRHTAKNVLEIGLFNGASLKVWEEYFTVADVYGIDCDGQPHGGMADLRPMIASGKHRIVIGDAANPHDIEKHFKGIKFDVVIEDSSHEINSQLQIYKVFKPYMNKNSIFVIEDVQSLDETRHLFENIDPEKSVKIIDRRAIKKRYDDVLIVIK